MDTLQSVIGSTEFKRWEVCVCVCVCVCVRVRMSMTCECWLSLGE